MSTTLDLLLRRVQSPQHRSANKVTVVGVGQVGMACAFSIVTQRISNDICLVDCIEEKLVGEMLDLQHSATFLNDCKISASTEYSITANSKLCIVAAGVRENAGETRLDLIQKNTNIMKSVIPALVEYSPNTIILVLTNPVDVLTFVAWKLSGLPKERVIGSGTHLDSSRFRFLISQKLGVATSCCYGWLIGENGESSVPVWSGVNVAGVNLTDLKSSIVDEGDPEKWHALHQQILDIAYQLRRRKGCAAWSIAMSVADIAQSILFNLGTINAVSVLAQGYHGIKDEVFLSLPAILGMNGITDIIIQPLTPRELFPLQASARTLAEIQKEIIF